MPESLHPLSGRSESADQTFITVRLPLSDARALATFARLGIAWTRRHEGTRRLTAHHLGRGLYTLGAAIDTATHPRRDAA